MYWKFHGKTVQKEWDLSLDLTWGWDAGLTPEQIQNRAEDSPSGLDGVSLNIETAEQLRDILNKFLTEENKNLSLELRRKFNKHLKESYSYLEEFKPFKDDCQQKSLKI